MRNSDRDELDDLIDGALPGYSDASPLEGLEERVLCRIHAAPAARRVPWPRRLAFAGSALTVLVLAIVVPRTCWNPQPPPANPAAARLRVMSWREDVVFFTSSTSLGCTL